MAAKKTGNQTGRRGFLKTVALAGGIAADQAEADVAAVKSPARPGARALSQVEQIRYPRIFAGRQLAMIAFPLGGVGAGSISLGGRGQLRDWEIFNRPDKGKSPQYAFPSLWVQTGTKKPVARVLESKLMPPYEGPSGLGFANAPGLPRLESATFKGEFPLARIDFADLTIGVKIALEAFTPFIPHEADDSGLPVAILRYRVSNPGAAAANISIAYSLDNPIGIQGRSNEYSSGAGLEGIIMRNPFLPKTDPYAGSIALAAIAGQNTKVSWLRGWHSGSRWRVGALAFWDDFSADGELGPEAPVRDTVASLCLNRVIPARGQADFTFVLAWHFPNRTPEHCGWTAPKGEERTIIGNYYCTRFADAWRAAEYAVSKMDDLERRTRRFVSLISETTLPDVVKEAAMANLSTLVTTTCFRTADGAFHGFEGSNNQLGCCFGNCTHVWNYELATNFLFPALARSLRESAFGYCTDAQGAMGFRQLLPDGKQRYGISAADGQMGQIMKLYLDWKISDDNGWLRKLWPSAKRALEFAWVPGGWDANKDGVMEGAQHNTYDVEFFGPNPLCGIWYLGALRAAEEMARVSGDNASALTYHDLFLRGSKWIDENLFNGEYFVQKVEGMPRDKIAKGLMSGMGAVSTEVPDLQVGDGCLVDQLLGQYFSHIAGLGLLVDQGHIRKTLESIYKYNYKRKLDQHESVQRVYALNDEAALVICDYGKRKRPAVPFPYFAEIMTGFEYVAAILMLFHDMTSQGVELIENVRKRYDGERRNPWNEAECGHHYARAMASWAAIPAMSGFEYDATQKAVTAVPRVNRSRFRSFWSSATGWGAFSQTITQGRKQFALSVEYGTLPCRSFRLQWIGRAAATIVSAAGQAAAHQARAENGYLDLTLAYEVMLRQGDKIAISA
jgi:non-lysosomal glucosylceramidase